MFYPQLVAGPIERPQNLLHQFYEHHHFNVENLMRGLSMMAWGYFQKMVIADRAAIYVNRVYGVWRVASGLELLIASVLFAVQIYADFAGYSYIAIGAARVMGFELMTNFNHPYFAKSIGQYWGRWHISLSTWFKDYVYFPLYGDTVTNSAPLSQPADYFCHQRAVAWRELELCTVGCLQRRTAGARRAGGQMVRKGWAWTTARHGVTLVLVLIGFVFFRSRTVPEAFTILGRIATSTSLTKASFEQAIIVATGDSSSIALMAATFLLTAVMFILEGMQEGRRVFFRDSIAQSVRWQAAAVVLLFQATMLFGVLRASSFIYFQF